MHDGEAASQHVTPWGVKDVEKSAQESKKQKRFPKSKLSVLSVLD
jgi:hypothetical protein